MMPRSTIQRHRDALRVRPGYWFAPKLYGFGATPVTWQGWAATAALVGTLVLVTVLVRDDGLRLAIFLPVLVGFLVLSWARTDGGWRWRWGPGD